MAEVKGHPIHDEEDGHFLGYVFEVGSSDAVETVLDADQDSDNGRSQYLWLRLGNGDLFLGVFPQGDTYSEVEGVVEADYRRAEDARQADEIKEEFRKT